MTLVAAFFALVLSSCGQAPTVPGHDVEPALRGEKDLRFERRLTPRSGVTSSAITTASIAGSAFELVGTIGAPPTGPGEFNYAAFVAVSDDGVVYVSDHFNDRVQRFAADGTFLGAWGGAGSGPGEFAEPSGIAVGSDGQVYVVDSGNHRVQRFNASGAYLGEWGHRGSGPGAFEGPWTIAFDPERQVLYVVDGGNQRIQRFDASGTFERAWSAGSGQSFQWASIAVAPTTGEVFVSDRNLDRVHVFGPDGDLQRSWGKFGTGIGELSSPEGIAVSSDGIVYVSEWNNRIQRFDPDGVYLGHWGAFGFDQGRFNAPNGLAVAAGGAVFVADRWNHRVQVFEPDGTFLLQWGNDPYAVGRFNLPSEVALAPSGRLYVAEPRRDRVQAFDAQGALQVVLEGDCPRGSDRCTGDGQFAFPWALTVDDEERVYLLDSYRGRVQRFDSGLAFESSWGEAWRDEFFFATDLATTSEGRIAVLGRSAWFGWEVRYFDSEGQELASWVLNRSDFGGGWWWIEVLGAGPDGTLHLGIEGGSECWIAVVDAAGHALRHYFAATTGQGTECSFWGGAVDVYGNTYASIGGIDWSGGGSYILMPEVLVFDRYGRERTRFGGPGMLRTPAGIDVGFDGTVAVADQLGHVVQLFAPKVRYAFGGFEPPVGPGLNLVDAGRSIPVRFGLGGDHGNDVAWAIDSVPIDCGSLAELGEPHPVSGPGGSGGRLRFDRKTETYGINWKTESEWLGTCRELVLMLSDMSVHSARFQFE